MSQLSFGTRTRAGVAAVLASALLALTAAQTTGPLAAGAAAADPVPAGKVQVGTRQATLSGTNVARGTHMLVRYTPAWGATTRTNRHGFEAEVVGGTVTRVQDGVGNMAIPAGGYVLSGHGTARTFLRTNAVVGAGVWLAGEDPVSPPPPPPPPPRPPPPVRPPPLPPVPVPPALGAG